MTVSLRKRDREQATEKHGPAADATPVVTAEPPQESEPIADAPKPAEQPTESNPVREAEVSAIQARLDEMNRAEQLSSRQPSQPPQPQYEPPEPQQLTVEEIIAGSGLPGRMQEWLRQHPDYVNDPVKNAKLIKMHHVAEYHGGGEWTDGYFDSLDHLLGFRPAVTNGDGAAPDVPPPPPIGVEGRRPAAPPRRQYAAPVSAPPTREAPSYSTGRPPSDSRITLTAEETAIAKACKLRDDEPDEVSIRRYAQEKMKALKAGVIGPGSRDGR